MKTQEQNPVLILTGNQIKDFLKEVIKEAMDEAKTENKNYFEDELLSKNEVCRLLKIKQSTFYNLIKNGKIKATKIKENGDWKVKYKDLKILL